MPKMPPKKDVSSDNSLQLFSSIKEEFVNLNPNVVYGRLMDELKTEINIFTNNSSMNAIINGLSTNYVEARKLFCIARKHVELYKIEIKGRLSDLNNKARNALESLKAQKEFSGQITVAAIDDWVAANYGTELAEIEDIKQDLRNIRDTFEALEFAWKERSRHVEMMIRVKTINPNP